MLMNLKYDLFIFLRLFLKDQLYIQLYTLTKKLFINSFYKPKSSLN